MSSRYRNSGGGDYEANFMMNSLNSLGNTITQNEKLKQARRAEEEQQRVSGAYNYIAERLGPTGDLSLLDNDPIMRTAHGTVAAGQFVQQMYNNNAYRQKAAQARIEGDNYLYNNSWLPLATQAEDAYNKGDMNKFTNSISRLSEISPLPYKLAPNQDGNFDVLFRDNKTGGFTNTGRSMSSDEALNYATSIMKGNQQVIAGAEGKVMNVNPIFMEVAARARSATVEQNTQNMTNSANWIEMTKNGQIYYGVPLNDVDNWSNPTAYLMQDKNGNTVGKFNGIEELRANGFNIMTQEQQGERQKGQSQYGQDAKTQAKNMNQVYDSKYK